MIVRQYRVFRPVIFQEVISMKLRSIVSAAAVCAVAAAAMMVPASAETSYTAAITFQSASYIYRNTFNQPSILYWDNELNEAADFEGASWTDATITGDGTYTVELSGVNDGGWNMLKLETNIDADVCPDAVLTITGVELNGASVDFDADAAAMDISGLASDSYSSESFNIANACRAQLINVYDNLAAIPNEGYDTVKITFEVSGLGGGASEATDTDTTTTTPSADKGSPDTGVEGIAVVAGAAIAAGGVLMLSKKRK